MFDYVTSGRLFKRRWNPMRLSSTAKLTRCPLQIVSRVKGDRVSARASLSCRSSSLLLSTWLAIAYARRAPSTSTWANTTRLMARPPGSTMGWQTCWLPDASKCPEMTVRPLLQVERG